MKTTALVCALLATVVTFAPGVRAAELLLNGGFESAVAGTTLATGNNIGVVPANWAVGTGYTASNSNLQNGANNNGGIILQPYNGPFSANSSTVTGTTGGGTNFWDGTGTANNAPVTLTQNFTLSTASNLAGSFAVGGRDPGSANVTTSVSFTGTTSGGATYTSPTQTGGTTNGVWTVKTFSLSNVPAGTYTYSIVLHDFQNIDGVSLISTAVPEPSTWAMLVGGLGLLSVVPRVRRATGT